MMPKPGDKVKLLGLGYAHHIHTISIGIGNEKDEYLVQEMSGYGFYVEGGHYYDDTDVNQIYTKEENPEYFL